MRCARSTLFAAACAFSFFVEHAPRLAGQTPVEESIALADDPTTGLPGGESVAAEEDAGPDYGFTGDWGGARQSLEERGITLGFTATLEANRVLSGGLRHRTTGHALYDLTASFDLERLLGLKGALIGFDAYVIDGHNPSDDAGDFQYFSDISSAREVAQISQLYYEQWFADQTLRFKLGKFDGNAEFGYPGTSGESLHASAVFSPTYFALPVYPNPATGVLAGWAPDPNWSVNVALMDGAAWTGINTGGLGPDTFFGEPADKFWIGEIGHRWQLGQDELAGGIKLGLWHHTGEFPNVLGGTNNGTAGFYVALDQELARASEDAGGGSTVGFLQFDKADKDIAPVDLHVGGGLCWTGLSGARPEDAFGGYVSWAHFSEDAGFTENAETAYELYYKWHCCSGVALQPDLQLISHPGGDETIDDAIVFSLRCELTF